MTQRTIARTAALMIAAVLLLPLTAQAQSAEENPFAGKDAAVKEGQSLYESYNCYACHGRAGGGGMGPSLTDNQWRYGNGDVALFKTIMEGRPEGMPGFSGALSEDQVWKLVTFVNSLSQESGGEEASAGTR